MRDDRRIVPGVVLAVVLAVVGLVVVGLFVAASVVMAGFGSNK